jgi:RNA polymerase II subunit A small phosphatase-like protein
VKKINLIRKKQMNRKEEHEKILLILDLDETLIYASKEQLEREADFRVEFYHVYKRPWLDKFIKYVSEHFLLAVWSSASDQYVSEVVGNIFPDKEGLEFVWGRSRCVQKRNLQIDDQGYFSDDYYAHYHYVKPLKKVKRRGFNLERILIIDDTPHKSQNNFGNAIYPRPYIGSTDDEELKIMMDYLDHLKDKDGVRKIEKRNWRYNTLQGNYGKKN